MKTAFLLITSVFFLFFGTSVLAQEIELPDPGLTPDSPFYFLEIIAEEIGTFFTFGDLKKAERYASLAEERLAEAKAVVEKGKPELAEKTLERYENQLEKSIARTEKAMFGGKDFDRVMEVMAKAGKTTSLHLEALTEVYEKVPEEAKTAVENAMKSSVKRHEKVVKALKSSNNLEGVPEEISLPDKVPQEVRERIQTKAQQELEIEEVLESIDTSKSLREICADQGGTPEMCEQFPLEKFESFEQIESWCTEVGGPEEICSSLKTMCEEYGVTTPNECFILLSVSSITTYNSAELKSVPASSMSEEEFREKARQMEEEARIRAEEDAKTGSAYLGVRSLVLVENAQTENPISHGAKLISGEGKDAVVPGSPAELAGLKEGDIILEFGGQKITIDNSLTEMIYISEPDTNIDLKVLRGEEEFTVSVKLIERPADLE